MKETIVLGGIDGSISKWKCIAHDRQIDYGYIDCPLCNLFNKSDTDIDKCVGCPIYDHTSEIYCSGTPYSNWTKYQHISHMAYKQPFGHMCVKDAYSQALANHMLSFLYVVRLDYINSLNRNRRGK